MTRQPGYRQPRHPVFRYILWAVTALLTVAAFSVATPYIFLLVGRIRPNDWAKFSNEGQAIGGIAALIGMLVVFGVVASLALQIRELEANRVQAERTFHAELVFKALEEPELIECWGGNPMPEKDLTAVRKRGYVNLIITYYYAMFEIGRWSDDTLRRLVADIFTGMPARDHWALAREGWRDHPSSDAVNHRFIEIMDEEYRRAVARGPAVRWPERKALATEPADERSTITGLAIGALCGAAIAGATAAILRRSRQ